jgi:predicted site-specific integrase-resolvase
MEEDFYTSKETAQILKISERTLERRRKGGQIKSAKDGARRFYSRESIRQYFSEMRKEK